MSLEKWTPKRRKKNSGCTTTNELEDRITGEIKTLSNPLKMNSANLIRERTERGVNANKKTTFSLRKTLSCLKKCSKTKSSTHNPTLVGRIKKNRCQEDQPWVVRPDQTTPLSQAHNEQKWRQFPNSLTAVAKTSGRSSCLLTWLRVLTRKSSSQLLMSL
jgi:hypothetical protein